MLGLLPPTAGHVLVDGHDIIIEPRPWRHLIGYVPQSVALTDDKLKRNVAFGVPKTEIDDDRVWHALRLAQLEDFARQLPDGLETMLGEDGVRLSGGQRQRIGIARALYHDPAVLFMDEATSSLDGETEREINLAIESLRGEKTLVVIAHRLSTVRRCDRLILLKDGKLVDNGGFEELFARCEEFRHMVKLAEMVALAPEDLSALAQSN
jgi:ATP-binding cassette subfamily C protein